MADWTADDIVAGRKPTDEDIYRRVREAMADPKLVTLKIVGRNGQIVEHRIPAGDRMALSVVQKYDREPPPDYEYSSPTRPELWAPGWTRTTWEIETRLSYRAEDFLPHPPKTQEEAPAAEDDEDDNEYWNNSHVSADDRVSYLNLHPSHRWVYWTEGDCWQGEHAPVHCQQCGLQPLGARCYHDLPWPALFIGGLAPTVVPEAREPCPEEPE